MPVSPSDSDKNKVQILIKAEDQASNVLTTIKSGLATIGDAALFAQSKLNATSAALIGLGSAGIRQLSQLTQVIGAVRNVAMSPIGQSLFEQIQEAAEEAIAEPQRLSAILKDLSKVGSVGISGFVDKQSNSVLNGIEGRFDRVAKNLSGKLINAFTNLPLEKIPFAGKFLNDSNLAVIGARLDQTLSQVLLEKFIGQQVPGALSAIANTFGVDLNGAIASGFQAISGTAAGKILPGFAKELLGGSAKSAIESQVSTVLTSSFSKGFVLLNSLVGKQSESLAQKVGTGMASSLGQQQGFKAIDTLFGGKLSAQLDKVLPALSQKLAEASGIKSSTEEIAAELALITSGTITTGSLGFLFGGSAGFAAATGGPLDNFVVEGLRKIESGFITGLPKLFARTFVGKGFEILLAQGLEGVLRRSAQKLIGKAALLPDAILEGVKQKLPPQLSGVFAFIESKFATQIEGFKSAIRKDVEGLANSIFAPLFSNKGAILENQIKRLQGQASRLPIPKESIEVLQRRATNIALDQNLDPARKAQYTERVNQQIAEAERIGKEADEIKSKIAAASKELEILRAKPQNLQQQAIDIALNPQLSQKTKDKLIDDLNKQIKEAENAISGSPLSRLGASIQNSFASVFTGNTNIQEEFLRLFGEIDETFDGIISQSLAELGNTAAKSFGKGFVSRIAGEIAPAVDQIDSIITGTVNKLQKLPQKLSQPLDFGAKATSVVVGLGEPLQILETIQSGSNLVFSTLSEVGQRLSYLSIGLQTLQQIVATGPFQVLIGQNIQLREQLLSTQSSLVGTNKVLQAGMAITDPTAAIQAVEGPVKNAIQRIREGSLELVGVTSSQLVESFQIIAGQVGAIGINLSQASDLTLSFAAALGTLGVPLFQARQEISSIVQGTIDQNSVVAKSLGITNDQIRAWKNSGKIFEELQKRLEAFRAGNKLAAETVGGYTSNIQEIIENIGLAAGEPLLDPIVNELKLIYEYLDNNKEVLIETVSNLAQELFNGLLAAWNAIKTLLSAVQEILGQVPQYLIQSFANALQAIAKAITNTVAVLEPAINLFTKLFESARALTGPFLELFFQFKVLQIGISGLGSGFGLLAQLLPGVGELLFGVNLRMLPMVNMLPSLSSQLGLGAAGFLLLGKNMNSIPGIAGIVVKQLGMFGPLAPLIAGLIPSIAGVGITIAGLAKNIPLVDKLVRSVFAASPAMTAAIAKLLQGSAALKPLGDALGMASDKLLVFSKNQDIGAVVTEKFNAILKDAGKQLRGYVTNLALTAGGAYLAFVAIDKFILKNEALLEILGSVSEGIGLFLQELTAIATSPAVVGIATFAAILGGIPAKIFAIAGAQLALGIGGISGGLTKLAAILTNLKLGVLAGGAAQAGVGLKALSIAMTQGTVASAQFLASSGVNIATLPVLGGAAGGASAGFATLATSIWTTVSGLAALVAPVALVVAAIGAIGLIRYSKNLADSTAASEEFGKQTDAIGESALALGKKLKAASDRQQAANERGIALSKEEYAQNDQLQKQRQFEIEQIDAQVATLKEAQKQAIGKANKENLENQIADLENMKRFLTEVGANIELAPKDLPELGQTLDQLEDKAEGAWNAVLNPSGDSEIFKKKSQEVIQFNQKLYEMGQISKEVFEEKLQQLATDARLDLEVQTQAQEAITQLIEKEAEKRIAALQSEQTEIQTLATEGKLGDFAKEQQLTELKLKEYEIRTEALKQQQEKALEFNNLEQAKKLGQELIKIEAQAAEERAKIRKREKEEALKDFDEQAAIAEAKFEQGRTRESNYNRESTKIQLEKNKEQLRQAKNSLSKLGSDDKEGREAINAEIAKLQTERQNILEAASKKEVELLERQQKKALDLVRAAETRRRIEIERLRNTGNIELNISEEKFAEQETQIARDRLEEELKLEQKRLSELNRQRKLNDPKAEEERQSRIRESRQKTNDLILQLLKAESDAYEKQATTILASLELAQNEQLLQEKEALNEGLTYKENIDAKQAQATVDRLQKQIELETRNKDQRVELEIELQDALAQLREAQTAEQLAQLQREQTQENILLEKSLYDGLALRETIDAQQARQTVERLEKELALEKVDKDKRLQLELELIKARGELRNAELAERLAKFQLQQNLELAILQDALNKGKAFQADIEAERAELALERIKIQIKAEKDQAKRAELQLQLREEEGRRNQALIQQQLAATERAQTEELILLERALREGTELRAQAELERSQNSVERIRQQLSLEQNADKRLELRLQLEEALTKEQQSRQALALSKLESTQLTELISLQKSLNRGIISNATAERERAANAVERIRTELELETDLLKRKQLQLQLEEAIASENRAIQAETLAEFDYQQTQKLTLLERQLNKGTALQVEAEEVRARAAVERIREELRLEKDRDKRAQLELQLEQALGKVREASVAKQRYLIEQQNQALQNQIERQNQALQKQAALYDSLNQALEMRKSLQSASQDLMSATAGYLTGELDAIAKTERSELKRRKLAEIAAAIKLQSAIKQAEFDQQSLKIEQEKTRLALEQQRIQNQIAISQQRAAIATADAEVKLAQSDPTTTPERLEALRLKAQAERSTLDNLYRQETLIENQAAIQEEIFRMERERQGLQSQTNIRSAQSEAISAITSPGQRRQLEKAQQQQILDELGVTNVNDLINRGQVTARQIVASTGLTQSSPTRLTPEEQLRETLGDGEYAGATDTVNRELYRRFGELQVGSPTQLSNAQPLQLPTALTQLPSVQVPEISDLATVIENREKSKLANQQQQIAPVFHVTVNATTDRAGQEIAKKIQPDLNRVAGMVYQMAN